MQIKSHVLIAVVLFASLGVAQARYPAAAELRSEAVPPKLPNSYQTSSPMPMSMTAPFFVADEWTSNTLTLVFDGLESLNVEVDVVDLNGITQVKFNDVIPAHGAIKVDLGAKLEQLGLVSPFFGSLIVIPTKPASVGAQLSIVRKDTVPDSQFEEELVMPDDALRNTFRAVATGANGLPIISLASLATVSQQMVLRCLDDSSTSITQSFTLMPRQVLYFSGCDVKHSFDVADLFRAKPSPNGSKLIGMSASSNAKAGSFAIFGVVPRSSTYGSLNFLQLDSNSRDTSVFSAVPVGRTNELNSLYQPEIGLVNFGSVVAHAQILYLSSENADIAPSIKGSLTLMPSSGVAVSLPDLTGDANMRNTILISSDSELGEVSSSVRSISLANSDSYIEIPTGADRKSTNGGQHPWISNDVEKSHLLLYNSDAKHAHVVDLQVYATGHQWNTATTLEPNETYNADLEELVVKVAANAKESAAKQRDMSGIAAWASLSSKAVFGRVIQINTAQLSARNFSCPNQTIVCGAQINDPAQNPAATIPVGSSLTVQGYGNTCVSVGQCTCNGSGACTSNTSTANSNNWFVDGAGVASISGSSDSQSVTVFGNSTGQTTLDLNVSDTFGCSGYGSGTVSVVSQTPDHLLVRNDISGTSTCSPNCYGAVYRDIYYQVVSQDNSNDNFTLPVQETLTNRSAMTCPGVPLGEPSGCQSVPYGQFTDQLSTNYGSPTPNNSCGFSQNQSFQWCPTSGTATIGTIAGTEVVDFDAITVNNVTTPNAIPAGTLIYP